MGIAPFHLLETWGKFVTAQSQRSARDHIHEGSPPEGMQRAKKNSPIFPSKFRAKCNDNRLKHAQKTAERDDDHVHDCNCGRRFPMCVDGEDDVFPERADPRSGHESP
jgi:hypothetical protein